MFAFKKRQGKIRPSLQRNSHPPQKRQSRQPLHIEPLEERIALTKQPFLDVHIFATSINTYNFISPQDNTDRKATVGVYDINLATSTAKRLVSAKDGDSFNPNTGITTYDAVYQPAGITADPTTTGAFYFSDLGLPRYPTDY